MRFLVDAQLPPAFARFLAAQGHEAEHVTDCGLQSASDYKIWDYASESHAAIVTKDEDFAQRRALVENGPIVIWIRLPNSRRKELLEWFDRALPAIMEALSAGDTLIEVR